MKVPIFVQKIEKFTLLFIALCFTIGLSYLLINSLLKRETKAATCGGATVCSCGDTVTSNYTLPADLACPPGNGLVVGAVGIIINGNNHTVTGDISSGAGVTNSGFINVTIKNLKITEFNRGIYIDNASGNIIESNIIEKTSPSSMGIWVWHSSSATLTNNHVSYGQDGIRVDNSPNCNLINNTSSFHFRSNFTLLDSNGCVLTNNTAYSGYLHGFFTLNSPSTFNGNNALYNAWDLNNGSPGSTFSNNNFFDTYGLSQMFSIVDMPRQKILGDTVNFDFTMYDTDHNTCPSCNFNITTSPAETVTSGRVGGQPERVQGSFQVTRPGTYSLIIEVIDSNNNVTKNSYRFLVDATGMQTTSLYLSRTKPVHGQPTGDDARSLTLIAPTSDEDVSWCGNWTQVSPDTLPNYPLSLVTAIDINTWYKIQPVVPPQPPLPILAIQKKGSYDPAGYDASSSVPDQDPAYGWINRNFPGLSWIMDYPWSWHRSTLKLIGASLPEIPMPYLHTKAATPSYADYTYTYTTTPAIRSVSNPYINVLSATIPPGDPTNPMIVVDGVGNTDITIENVNKAFLDYQSALNADGSATLSLTNLTGLTTISAPTNLTAVPSAGSVVINILTWHTTGDYYKKWTEDGTPAIITTNHTVGDLKPNKTYLIRVNGVTLTNVLSDGLGQLNFNYTGGYSTKTFEIGVLAGSRLPGFTGTAGVAINNGDAQTTSRNVNLTLTASTAQEMLICNDAGFVGCDWEPYVAQKDWVLTEGAGVKTVYALFKDINNNQSNLVSDGIELVEIVAAPVQLSHCVPVESLSLPENLKIGDLIKIFNSTTVYMIGCDGLRHPFPNESTYFTWYTSFDGIKIVSAESISKINMGSNVTVRPGTLVKSYTIKTVYAVEPGAVLRPIESETVAAELYGDKWNKIITDIPDVFWTDYEVANPVSRSMHPTAAIIQYRGTTERYYIDNGVKRLMMPEVFVHNLYQERFIIDNVSSAVFSYPAGENLPAMDIASIMTFK